MAIKKSEQLRILFVYVCWSNKLHFLVSRKITGFSLAENKCNFHEMKSCKVVTQVQITNRL